MNKAIVLMKKYDKGFDLHKNKLLKNCRNNLMGIEGSIARTYFQAISPCLPVEYQFNKRSRRPALDNFNAALNYLYGMTYTIVESGIFSVGLDPQLGFLHADAYNKPTLSFDLIEPFRPWIDRLLIEQCLSKKITAKFFTQNQHGIFLNKNGKAVIIPLFNDFLREEQVFQTRRLTNRNHIYTLAGLLSVKIKRFLEEQLKTDNKTPF